MKIRLAAITAFVALLAYSRLTTPKHTVTAPTARYSGHTLNREAIRRTKEFTVLISAEGFGGVSRGTGILVDKTHVLTCAHVASHGNDELWVYTYPLGSVIRARPVFMSRANDLAILELARPVNGAPMATFQTKHYDGEPITIIGNILGSMKWFVGYGIISGENDRDLYTDGLVLGGDSGGPWINEMGEVVALSDWGLQRGEQVLGINGGVSARVILAFLESWRHPSLLSLLMQ